MKKLISLFLISVSTVANACWYNFYNYEDYIFGINNFERHSDVSFITENNKQTTKYKVTNNMVVDFPISVSIKLTSNILQFDNTNQEKNMLLYNIEFYHMVIG